MIAACLLAGRRTVSAGALLLVALVPLLLDLSIAKAVFIWLGLIGPIVMLVVIWKGLQQISD